MSELFLVVILYALPGMPADNIFYQQTRCETEEEMALCNEIFNQISHVVTVNHLTENDFWIYFDDLSPGAYDFRYMKRGNQVEYFRD